MDYALEDLRDSDVVEVPYRCFIRETAMAKQYSFGDNPFEPNRQWIPKSQIIEDDGEQISIPYWLAQAKELV